MLHSICQQIWPQDWKRSVFIPNPKRGNAKECSNYRTIALISYASKVILKILQSRHQQYMNHELPDVQAGIRKGRGGRGTRDQTANITGSSKKQESSRKTSPSTLLTMPNSLTVCITRIFQHHWKILQETGIADHLTYLLRNVYAGQEVTVGTGHRTTELFQIGKGVYQGCVLSPCLFNLYEGYISHFM